MMKHLKPSEVRAVMLREIEGLRGSLHALGRAAESDHGRLRECSGDLCARLEVYLERENSILARALEKTDYWGPNRLKAMQRAHSAHWAAAGELARAADRPEADLSELARTARSLRSDLIRDLDEDERCLLIAEVLQDDESSSDQSDG